MKHGKRPKLKHKKLLKFLARNPENWLISEDSNEFFIIVHKHTGRAEIYDKRNNYKKISAKNKRK